MACERALRILSPLWKPNSSRHWPTRMSDGLQGVSFARILLLRHLVTSVELRALFWSANLLSPYFCSVDQVTVYAGVLATVAIMSDSQHIRGYGFPKSRTRSRSCTCRAESGYYRWPGWSLQAEQPRFHAQGSVITRCPWRLFKTSIHFPAPIRVLSHTWSANMWGQSVKRSHVVNWNSRLQGTLLY
jgi:hypothetical protein